MSEQERYRLRREYLDIAYRMVDELAQSKLPAEGDLALLRSHASEFEEEDADYLVLHSKIMEMISGLDFTPAQNILMDISRLRAPLI